MPKAAWQTGAINYAPDDPAYDAEIHNTMDEINTLTDSGQPAWMQGTPVGAKPGTPEQPAWMSGTPVRSAASSKEALRSEPTPARDMSLPGAFAEAMSRGSQAGKEQLKSNLEGGGILSNPIIAKGGAALEQGVQTGLNLLGIGGEYTRGLFAGKPGERVSPEELARSAYSPEEWAALPPWRQKASMFVAGLIDPMSLVGTGAAKKTADAIKAIRAAKPLEAVSAAKAGEAARSTPIQEAMKTTIPEAMTPPAKSTPAIQDLAARHQQGLAEGQQVAEQRALMEKAGLQPKILDQAAADANAKLTAKPEPPAVQAVTKAVQDGKPSLGRFPEGDSKPVLGPATEATGSRLPSEAEALAMKDFHTEMEGLTANTRASRTNLTTLDALTAMEKTGPEGKTAAGLMRTVDDNTERAASQIVTAVDQQMAAIFGRRGVVGRTNPLKDGGMQKYYNVTEGQQKELVDYLYSGGTTLPTDPKVKLAGDVFFNEGTFPVSNHPGVRNLQVLQPDGSYTGVGKPSMFFPQQPVTPNRSALLQPMTFNRLYKAQLAKEPGLTRDTYRARLDQLSKEPVQTQRFKGMENARAFDASMGGTESAYANLKKFGYETDPMRALTRYVAAGVRRGENELVTPGLQGVKDQLTLLAQAHPEDAKLLKHSDWVSKVIDRHQGVDVELADKQIQDWGSTVRNINNATLLQLAALGNTNQVSYAFSRGGMMNTLKAMAKTRGFTKDTGDLAKRSGAVFPDIMQDFTAPVDAVGKFAQAQLRANGFQAVDRWGRFVGAHIADSYLETTTAKLVKDPTNTVLRKRLTELRVNPDEVIARGGLSEEERLHGVQTFANMSQGRTNLQSLPLFMTSSDPGVRVLTQFKKFAFSNLTEMRRQILDAPNVSVGLGRALRLGASATIAGEVTKDLQHAITRFEDPFTENRTSKSIRKLTGDNPVVARLVDDFLYGIAAIPAMAATAAVQGGYAVTSLVLGPTAGLVGDVANDLPPFVTPEPTKLTPVESGTGLGGY